MKLIIDISKDKYDEIMSMDWNNCRRFFDEEIRAIHDGKVLEQGPFGDAVSRQAVLDINERHHGQMPNHVKHEIWKEIKALPSVTPQPCDDAISRQEVLDEIDKRFDLAKPFKQLIKSMPPVTPQQKMGRWAVLKDEYGDVIEDVCSCCDKNGNYKWAFCPFCGCKMQEVEND